MVWEGKITMSAPLGGKRGRPVRLGKYAVPRTVSVTMTGAKGGPDLAMVFEMRDGRPECVDIHISAKPRGRGIRNADLAVFNIDTMAEGAFLRHAMEVQELPSGAVAMTPLSSENQRRDAHKDVYEARRRTRGVVSEEELQQVADIYRSHLGAAPVQAVTTLLGYSERTAARRIKEARHRGILDGDRQED